ncbi:unnamed protein product [Tilletia controversa]|uniref:37S ribosomal protein S35, mitochondrial n=2 Tax=Tilletia TaxID=13289 RepID=A0A177VC41_9BASI|nr:hypothetical protein CF336_g5721 [Tilletia laevis]KAE8256726.1 hypothetical protein A4X03_0g5117 [Tilletia caries]CAD6906267.1 unnamed protein product [Tilletia controversa]KAE8195594.1 hypothetical protein CF335_g5061 [Tilletia laevis]CAD6884792.1 unnamed protein product [Tilletia caries]
MFGLARTTTTTTTTAARVAAATRVSLGIDPSSSSSSSSSSGAAFVRTFASSSRSPQAAPVGSSSADPNSSSSSSTQQQQSSSSSSSSSPRDRMRRFGQGSASSAPRDPSGGSGASGFRGRTSAGPSGPGGQRDNRRRSGQQGGAARPGRSRRGPTSILPFEQWIKGPIAARYKETPTTRGPHWIGDTPFPLNTSFQPPAPIHAKVKDELWRLHAADPAEHTVRALSSQFSIGIPRVEAILRLKALELEFRQKGHPLQTEFQSNMDRLLGSELRPNLNPEQSPVPERAHHSPRGQIFEEKPESASDKGYGSILAPALAAVEAEQEAAVRALPNRGVDHDAISPPRTIGSSSKSSTSSSALKQRAVLTVVNVAGRSYEGDGRIARNQKRAVKRSKVKAKQRESRAVSAAAREVAAQQKSAARRAARAASA